MPINEMRDMLAKLMPAYTWTFHRPPTRARNKHDLPSAKKKARSKLGSYTINATGKGHRRTTLKVHQNPDGTFGAAFYNSTKCLAHALRCKSLAVAFRVVQDSLDKQDWEFGRAVFAMQTARAIPNYIL